uniref:Uncharacterized protein n=1 Tax=Solanum lycopersicum TaxID=4081 RepID=A0A3Q7J7L5_SOLLC
MKKAIELTEQVDTKGIQKLWGVSMEKKLLMSNGLEKTWFPYKTIRSKIDYFLDEVSDTWYSPYQDLKSMMGGSLKVME